MNYASANLNPALPCFNDETKHIILYGQQNTWASWMNPAGSTINLVGNKSMNVLNIIYIWDTILKVDIVDRVRARKEQALQQEMPCATMASMA